MKALSLQQPWAYLIVEGKKTIELRTWNTEFRGPFLVHASKKVNKQACEEHGVNKCHSGGVIGRAEIVDVIVYNTPEELNKDCDKHLSKPVLEGHKKKFPVYGFVIKNPERVQFKPRRGQLGFFDLPF